MIWSMRLRDWRLEKNLNLRELAELIGEGGGSNPARRAQRIETGESPVDAPLADRIVAATSEKVTLQDLHDTRRDWLNSNQEAVS